MISSRREAERKKGIQEAERLSMKLHYRIIHTMKLSLWTWEGDRLAADGAIAPQSNETAPWSVR
jgi:hypothetical protein